MNVFMLLTHKANTSYLLSSDLISEGLQKLRDSGFSALPVLDKEGHYVGSVSEGDFLWNILDNSEDKKYTERTRVKSIMRKDFSPAVRVDVQMETLFSSAIRQNFIPVIDDRDFFIGIVTRKDIILAYNKLVEQQK